MAGSSPSRAQRLRNLAATALVLVACDNFDFGRVTGHPNAGPSVAHPPSGPGPVASPSTIPAPIEGSRGEGIVVLGGDIGLGGNARARLAANKKYDPLAGLRPILDGADFSLASLVAPVTGLGAEALAHSGLRILDVGSERLWASGRRALVDTLSDLARAGVLTAGASAESGKAWEPARLTQHGTTIAVVATAPWSTKDPALGEAREHVALYDAARLAESVRDAKRSGAIVIVSAGGAPEYGESPSPDEIALGRAAIDAGADAVVAHGAHVPLGVGFTAGRPIFYGLGNLIADDDPKNPWSTRGFVARITLQKRTIGSIDLCPFLIVDGEPKLLAGASRTTEEGIFGRALARLSASLGTLNIGEPDLHSCFRVAPLEAAPR